MGWLDNYGKTENANDGKSKGMPGFVGEGTTNKGRNYSPAWGGQFAMGGSLPGSVGFNYARTGAPSNGKYAKKTLPSAQNGTKTKPELKKLMMDVKKRTKYDPVAKEIQSEDLRRYVSTQEYEEAKKKEARQVVADRKKRIKDSIAAEKIPYTKENWRQQLADKTQAIGDKFRLYPEDPNSFFDEYFNPGVLIGDMASGIGRAPLRAQQQDSYVPYVTGVGAPLISEELGRIDNTPTRVNGGVIKDNRGQWAYPGEITEINSNDITMKGVPYDVLGISDTGDMKHMKPGKNYKYKGKKVVEFPIGKNGKELQKLDQLTNFTNYNKRQPGGWLDNL